MGMDPKQQRVLDEGEAGPADRPRDTSREAVRDQEERPPQDGDVQRAEREERAGR